MKVSLRFHNDTYAPGVATYGIPGKPGDQGLPGMSMFFTDYIISDSSDFIEFAQRITSRKLPLKNKDIILDRVYVNGDTFVTPAGIVYRLKDIDKLTIKTKNAETFNTTDIIEQIGKFNKDNALFTNNSGKLTRSGQTIISDAAISTGDGLLTLIKKYNTNGDVNFINMEALYGGSLKVDLNIKYNNQYKGFVLSSKYPVFLDANVYVKNSSPVLTNEFSPVLITENSVTKYIAACKGINCSINASIFSYNKKDSSAIYYGTIYKVSLGNTDNLNSFYVDSSISIHLLNKEYQDFQVYRNEQKTYYFRQDYDYVKLNDLINTVTFKDINNIKVSLINNVEVYLTPTNRIVSGMDMSRPIEENKKDD